MRPRPSEQEERNGPLRAVMTTMTIARREAEARRPLLPLRRAARRARLLSRVAPSGVRRRVRSEARRRDRARAPHRVRSEARREARRPLRRAARRAQLLSAPARALSANNRRVRRRVAAPPRARAPVPVPREAAPIFRVATPPEVPRTAGVRTAAARAAIFRVATPPEVSRAAVPRRASAAVLMCDAGPPCAASPSEEALNRGRDAQQARTMMTIRVPTCREAGLPSGPGKTGRRRRGITPIRRARRPRLGPDRIRPGSGDRDAR